MPTKSALLNPRAQNKQLKTFAFLRTQIASGHTDSFDCLTPFLVHACANFVGEQYQEIELSDFIFSNYRIRLPIYLLTEVRRKLESIEAVKEDSMTGAYICLDATQSLSEQKDESTLGDDDFDRLERSLNHYAKDQNIANPRGSDTWESALISYFQEDTEEAPKRTNIHNTLISDGRRLDNFVISEFILSIQDDKELFRVIEMVYFGVLIAEFLTTFWKTGNARAFQGLEVVYDVTFLMRLAGTSGTLYQRATSELHETIQHLGCKTFYFHHTYDELQANIDALIVACENRSSMHHETQAAVQSREISVEQIRLIRQEADQILAQHGITQHDASYRDVEKSNLYQIDERALAETLGKGRTARGGRDVWVRDAQSVALIQRLRRNHSSKDVAESKAVIVTTNSYFSRKTRKFLVDENVLGERDVSPVLTVGQMAIISWIADENQQQPSELSRELIANCYKASTPDEKWNNEFEQQLNKIDDQNAKSQLESMLITQGVREIAYRRSFGEASLVRKLNLIELIHEAEKEATNQARDAKQKGFEEGRSNALAEQSERYWLTAKIFARRLIQTTLWVFLIFYMTFYVYMLIGEASGKWLIIGGALAFIITFFSLASLFKKIDFGNLIDRMEDSVGKLIYNRLYKGSS